MSQTQNIQEKANKGIVFRLIERENFPSRSIKSESDVQLKKYYEIHITRAGEYGTKRMFLDTHDSETARILFNQVVDKYAATLEEKEVAKRIIQISSNE